MARSQLIAKYASEYIVCALKKLGFALTVDNETYDTSASFDKIARDNYYGLTIPRDIFTAFVKCDYKVSSGDIKTLLLKEKQATLMIEALKLVKKFKIDTVDDLNDLIKDR